MSNEVGRIASFAGFAPQLLTSRPYERESLLEYKSWAGGDLRRENLDGYRLVDIRGRGGAGFPFLRKLETARQRAIPDLCLVVNGEEGEPGSCKDEYLMRFRPHLVIDGALCVAALIQATRVVFYVSSRAAVASLRAALSEQTPVIPFEVLECPATYVAGEETAVVRWIDHRDARPLDKPPRPFVSGVAGKPTLISNVETFAAVAVVFRLGVQSRSFLATVSVEGKFPTLLEVPFGVRVRDLAQESGADAHGVVACGGLFGGILPANAATELTTDAMLASGSSLGSGAFAFFSERRSVVAVAAKIASLIKASSAGQCGSCVNGAASLQKAFASLVAGGAGDSVLEDVRRWAAGMRGRGACALPDSASVLVGTLFRFFEKELNERAGSLVPLSTSAIDFEVSLA